MLIPKKYIVVIGLSVTAMLCGAAIEPAKRADTPFKNLQVLPADITSKQLSKIMVDEFEDDLGVTCNFCHAENKDTHKPDYASDEKPEKQIARAMMKMTIGINEQYFELKHPMVGDSVLAISCNTCHNGQPRPEEVSTK
jgi:cytochrome c5